MSAHSPAEWRATDPCLCTHLYTGWTAAIFDYFTLHFSLMSSRCSLQQLHTYLGEQRGAFRHIWLWQKPLFAVCCWCKLFRHIGHISFHTDVEPSARCCPFFSSSICHMSWNNQVALIMCSKDRKDLVKWHGIGWIKVQQHTHTQTHTLKKAIKHIVAVPLNCHASILFLGINNSGFPCLVAKNELLN